MQTSLSFALVNRPLESLLLAAGAIILIVLTVQAFRLILRKLGLSKRLSRADENTILRDINELDAKIHEFEKRVETLEDLATGYYSSLMDVAGFSERLQILGRYRDRLIQLMVDIETLIDRENFVKLQRVLRFLAGSAVISGEALGSIVLAEDDVCLNGWEKKTTPMIVECCADLERVAGEMVKIRMIDPNRKRKPTLLRLQELRDRLLFQS
jgi:hypothetical protein